MKKLLLTIVFFIPLLICPVAVFGAEDFGLTTAATTGGLAENQISQAGDIPTVLGNIISIALSLCILLPLPAARITIPTFLSGFIFS